jgi:hypothetical protein
VVRLEISLRPFRFQQHNHGRLSLIWTLLIVGVPIAELLIRLLVVGHACDSGTEVVIRGLYQQDLTGFFGYKVKITIFLIHDKKITAFNLQLKETASRKSCRDKGIPIDIL